MIFISVKFSVRSTDIALTFISPHRSSSGDRWDDFFLSYAKDFKDVILLENDQLLRRFVLRRS